LKSSESTEQHAQRNRTHMNTTATLPQQEIHPTHMKIAQHRDVDQTFPHCHQLPYAYALAEPSKPHDYLEGRWRDSIASARASTQTVADNIDWASVHQSRGFFSPPSVRASLILKGQGTVLPTLSPEKVEWKALQKDEVSQGRRSLVVGKALFENFPEAFVLNRASSCF